MCVSIIQSKLTFAHSYLQGNHSHCDPDSKCKKHGYQCSKVKLTNSRAIAALHKFILESKVYKLAEDYYLVIQHFVTYEERVVRMVFSLTC